MIIDGGKGQLSSVMEVMEDLGVAERVAVLSVAKGEERDAGRERMLMPDGDEFMLAPDNPALHLIQRLRDEAHRFAIGTHRTKRDKAMLESGLDALPGIGPKRKKALLNHFGSAKVVQVAAIDDLCQVEGISRQMATQIYNTYNEVQNQG